jgi:O-antigen biosynthesis protein WbqP
MKFLFAFFLLILLLIPLLIISILILFTSKGPVIYWSDRIGKNSVIFKMPKFRTMKVNTPQVSSDMLEDFDTHISLLGGFLRRTSLDELPQVFSILKGDMGFVGPRPALFNQFELISLRKIHGIDKLVPGITGWAQINGRDNLSDAAKVALELEYMANKSFWLDIKILLVTIFKVMSKEGVSH